MLNGHNELLQGRTEIILRESNFQYDPISNAYYINNPYNNKKIINDVIDYLEKKKIAVDITDEISQFQLDYKQEGINYEKSRQLGLKVKEEKLEEIKQPPNFVRLLKPYQVKAMNHLIAVKAGANFSVSGSGKTTTAYGAYDVWKELGEVNKILVIGPLSSFFAWEDEYKKSFGKKVNSARLVGVYRDKYYRNPHYYELFLTSYQTASNDLPKLTRLLGTGKFFLVVDESHNIKRFNNGCWSESILKLANFATKRLICSGTPVPNTLLDLYYPFTFLWPNKQLLGEKNVFYWRYKDSQDFNSLRELVYPFYFRVRKSDLNLLDPIEHRYYINGSDIQMEINDLIEHDLLKNYLRLSNVELMAIQEWKRAKAIRLMQVATNPALLTESADEYEIIPFQNRDSNILDKIKNYSQLEFPAKFREAINLAKRLLNDGEKVIIWANFISNLLKLYDHFENIGISRYIIYGAVPRDSSVNEEFNREKEIHDFLNDPEPAILIANPTACGESISLHTQCHHAIYLSRTFNCGKFLQSMDRIHRIGLPNNIETHYYYFMTKNTIDEVIDRRLEIKKNRMLSLIEQDIPVGLDYELVEWCKNSEFDDDFNCILKQLKIKYRERGF